MAKIMMIITRGDEAIWSFSVKYLVLTFRYQLIFEFSAELPSPKIYVS